VELPNVSAFSASAEKAVDELQVAWQGIKETYRKHGESSPMPPTPIPAP